MPFDFEEYQKKCDELTTEQLHREWEQYTGQIVGDNLVTPTATCIMFSPFTGDVSHVEHGVSTPRIQDARKKREIIEARLQTRGIKYSPKKRDGIVARDDAGADSIRGTLIEHKHDEYSKKAEEKRAATQAEPRLNQPSLNTNNPIAQTSQQDTPPASDDEDKVNQWLAGAGRGPEHAKVEGIRDSVLVKDDLETTYRYLDSYDLGEEDDDEIQTPQYSTADQKDEDIPGRTASHQLPLTPPPEVTQTIGLDQPVLQPKCNEVLEHKGLVPPPIPPKTPSAPSSHSPMLSRTQVHPQDQTALVTQGNCQAGSFSSLVTPDMTPPAPLYPEPPVQQSTVPVLPTNGFGSPAQNSFDDTASPSIRSIEEEISWLKARLVQLENEKRETATATARNTPRPTAESLQTRTQQDNASTITVVESDSDDSSSLVATPTFDVRDFQSEAITRTTSPPVSTEYIPPPPPPPSIDQFLRNYVPHSSEPFGKWKRRPERMQFLPPPLPLSSQRPISPGLPQRSPGYPQISPSMPYFSGAAASPRLQNIPPPPSSPPPSARHQNLPPNLPPLPSSPPPNSPRNLPPPPSSPPPHARSHQHTSSYPYNPQVFRQASPGPSPSYNPATFPTQYASIASPASPLGRLSSSMSPPPPYFAPPPPTPPPGGNINVLVMKERDYFMQVQELGFGNGRSEEYSPPPENFYQNCN